jgi:hypothetical protein
MPLLNGRRFLDARLTSILAQTLTDWELIVCDSHSTDGSWEYLQAFAHDPRVRLYQVPRAGIYAGWNECLRRVRGRYVTIATADDTAQPEFLERLVGILEQHPDVHLAACQFDFIDESGRAIAGHPKENPNACLGEWLTVSHRRSGWLDVLIHLVRGGAWTTITSVVFRAELLAKTGLFMERETPVVDQLWAARTALHTDSIWLPERLATWRIHPDQRSSQWTRRTGWRQLQLTERTIEECAQHLPPEWTADPHWREKLMWGAWHFYHMCYGLNRTTLRQRPAKFLADLAWGLAHEPGYVMKRLASGLTWKAPEYEDSTAYLMRLVRDWHVPWPPSEM